MSEERPSLLEFPCDFPIKAFGSSQADMQALTVALVRRHAPDLQETAVACRVSGGGKYTAITVTVRAHSQSQLDAIYRELTACPDILMVL